MKLDNIQIGETGEESKYILEDTSVRNHKEKRYYGGLQANPDESIKHVHPRNAREFDSKNKAISLAKKHGYYNKLKAVKYEDAI